MITDKEAIFLAERCFGYREVADLLKSQKSIVFKCNAVFQLAMCGEFALKFILHTNSVDVSSTHNHKILIRCCGENKIQIPKIDFAEKVRINKEADKTLETILSKRYDTFDQHVEVGKITDLEVAKMVIKRLLDKLA